MVGADGKILIDDMEIVEENRLYCADIFYIKEDDLKYHDTECS